jgi:hypothetical protein
VYCKFFINWIKLKTLCSKRVVLFELVGPVVEYFEFAWVQEFYDSDSRPSYGCYDTLQRLAHHHAPKPASGKMLEKKTEN